MKHALLKSRTKKSTRLSAVLLAIMALFFSTAQANNLKIPTNGLNSQTLTLITTRPKVDAEASSKTALETLKNDYLAVATSESFPPTNDVAAAPPFMMPTIDLLSPCVCRENAPNSNGNATTLTNGQFIDTIQITATTGDVWMLISATGFHDINSPQPPAAPADYPVNTLLSESSPGSGIFQLEGIHVDDVGYTATVSNGTDTLSISNTCAYPNPAIIDLRTGYCTNSNSTPLLADNQGLTGTGTFDILNATNNTTIQLDATEFSGQMLGEGAYIVRYTFAEDNGCTQAVEQNIDVVSPFMSLFCNNNTQVSFDGDCEIVVTPDMVLEGTYSSLGIFDVEVYDNTILIGNTISSAYAGETLTTKVINTCSGNYCWGSITVTDYMGPVFDCSSDTIRLACTASSDNIAAPIATDNCEGNVTPILFDENIENFDCAPNGLTQRIERQWIAFDSEGNISNDTCIQIIEIERADLADINFPADVVFACGSNPNTDTNSTGLPSVDGLEITPGSLCNIAIDFTDDTIQTCGASYKIVRTWTAIDWCVPTSPGVNPLVEEQVIAVADQTAPSISAPDTIQLSINQNDCTASFLLPMPVVTDACSTFEVEAFTPFGNIQNIDTEEVTGLGMGDFTITYQATDICGNISQFNMIAVIRDQYAPIMVCDEITTTTLNTSGEAEVFAETFNDGSYDFCSNNLDLAVRRMDMPTYGPSVLFTCADVNSTIMVELQGTDFFGNTNSCMVEITVEDKAAPILTCPSDITIECTQDYDDLEITGFINFIEACNVVQSSVNNTLVNINSCGVGFVNRVFTVVDESGNASNCDQLIIIENSNPFTAANISFPADYAAPDCTDPPTLTPDGLPAPFDRPVITNVPCAQVAVAFEDEIFDIASPACFKIMRTWTVIDWCQYNGVNNTNGGIWTSTQAIEVTDNTAPVIFGCPLSPFMKIANPDCDTSVILPIPDSIIDCSPEIIISAFGDLGIGLGPFPNTSPGFYDVTITATDGCGNQSSCFYVLRVDDGKAPTPYCQNLVTVLMPMGGMVEANAEMFNVGSFDNCTAPEDLVFSFSNNPLDTVQQFTCNDFIGGPVEVEMHVFDEEFNEDFCVVTLDLQDPNGICDNELIMAGTISTEMGAGVSDVNVAYSGMGNGTMMTGNDGMFSFQLIEGEDYTITPEKDINLLNGITTYDLVLMSRHILGTQLLDSPYKIIAADINRNNAVTTADLVVLKKAILQETFEFTNNTSWRFVDASHNFVNAANPFQAGFPELFSINNLPSDVLDADFIGVKIGDVNNTASPNNLTGNLEERTSNSELVFEIDDQNISEGEVITVYFDANNFENIAGYQFSLQFDTDALEFVEIVESEHVTASDFGLSQVSEGKITTSWYNYGKKLVNSKFGLKFVAYKETTLKNVLQLRQNNPIVSEAYLHQNDAIEQLKIRLQFNPSNSSTSVIQLYQNYPNPFNQGTTIPFHTKKTAEIQLEIIATTGQIILVQEAIYPAGQHEIGFDREQFPSAGVYFYRISDGNTIVTKRMIIE